MDQLQPRGSRVGAKGLSPAVTSRPREEWGACPWGWGSGSGEGARPPSGTLVGNHCGGWVFPKFHPPPVFLFTKGRFGALGSLKAQVIQTFEPLCCLSLSLCSFETLGSCVASLWSRSHGDNGTTYLRVMRTECPHAARCPAHAALVHVSGCFPRRISFSLFRVTPPVAGLWPGPGLTVLTRLLQQVGQGPPW